MIRTLLSYFDISKGKIYIDGQDVRDITQQSLHDAIAIMPQDGSMFQLRIRENLMIAKENMHEQQMIKACREANIHTNIISTIAGYSTMVGERGGRVSGGKKQRITIALAIFKNSSVLI